MIASTLAGSTVISVVAKDLAGSNLPVNFAESAVASVPIAIAGDGAIADGGAVPASSIC